MAVVIFFAIIIIGFMYEEMNSSKKYYENELGKYRK